MEPSFVCLCVMLTGTHIAHNIRPLPTGLGQPLAGPGPVARTLFLCVRSVLSLNKHKEIKIKFYLILFYC